MPALQPISDPEPIIDIEPLSEGLAEVIPLFGAALPETIGVLPAGAIILGGIQIDNYLLRQKWWNDFWVGVGGRLNDVWHSVAGHLFGHPSSAPSLDTVSQLIQLSAHVSLRATRQLVGVLSSHTGSAIARIYKGVISVARSVNSLRDFTVATFNAQAAHVNARFLADEKRAGALAINAVHSADALAAHRVAALRAELLRDIIDPLRREVSGLNTLSHDALNVAHSTSTLVRSHLVPEIAGAAAAAKAAQLAVAALKSWEDDCGEPMCQTVGPKTDWGKLFKRFGTAGLLALLAAVEALDPKAVEQASEDFAHTIGPVLERWATEWLGLAPAAVGGEVSEVGQDVGQLTL